MPRRALAPSSEEVALRLQSWSGKTIYDVGANLGTFTLFFARQSGGGRVVAFEPHPGSFKKLQRNLELNRIRNVTTFNFGLGGAAGRRQAVVMPGAAGTASVALPEVPDARYQVAGSFEIKVLDEVISDFRLPAPNFVKIDVEGAELEVLLGAEATLTRAKPDLFIELHDAGPLGMAEAAEALLGFLTQCGYTAVHVESAARLALGSYLPGDGHWLCTSRARRHTATAAAAHAETVAAA